MSDLPDAPDFDMESIDSHEMTLESPPTKEKAREGHARFIAELQEKQEFAILESIVKQPSISPAQAVEHLVKLTLQREAEDEVDSHCYDTACSFLEIVARTTPDQQQSLISFFHQLRAVTVADPATGKPIRSDDVVVWEDLPAFGYTIADELGGFSGTDDYTTEEVQRWENLMAFFAQLDASTADPRLDFSKTKALTALSWAFENPGSSGPTDTSFRLACLWYIFDADKLWCNVSSRQSEDYTLENWNRWKQCLVDRRSAFVDERTRALIDGALAQINRVDANT